ncbi:lamin tail domain-containing protein [Pseudoxanthomonas sangjuensis]|uniref:Calx-beta domain-containing protein n=1 Tax=Pseudoxanthomonas sangjuensis TaxID=1503750 RepID=UPI001391DBA8|nr:Calx-beta domain-containing protein [Pseudoxanthomonas sangjuensis]KAF1713908.1 nuclease [Pseudoxanthomonas sangjuensis]
MELSRGRCAAIALSVFALCLAASAQAQVVISQVYGGGGNSGAPYTNDYVELFNRGATPESLAGKSVQYASATGTGNFGSASNLIVVLPNATLQPGQYFLLGLAGGSNGSALPATDASGTINMSGSAGKVALVNSTSGLGCNGGSTACSAEQLALIADLVGFGDANFYDGAPAPTLSNTLAAFRADGGCTDTDNNAADFSAAAPAPRNSASPAHVCGGGGLPALTIADIAIDEAAGNAVFTLRLSAPAGAEGASVAYSTADGSAQAGSDYVAASGTATFAAGTDATTVSIALIDDAVTEANETFFVDFSDANGLALGDTRAQATIVNDDVTLSAIHDIQGNGATSPLDGALVYTTGIVTGRKGNGFFLQAPDSEADADPATSEGVYVFTGSAPPAAAAVGNLVRVSGVVDEYVPAADPYQLPLTEISGNPTVTLLSTGHALPVPVPVTADLTRPDGGFGQLEHLEGMRVSVASLTTVAATEGNATPYNATGSANGIIYAVVTGVPRPFREPGLQLPDPIPGGAGAQPIPRWDGNPEILTIDSDGLGGPAYLLDLPAGSVIEGLTGPLDYGFRRYTVMRDPQVDITVTPAPGPRAAREASADEFTVAAANLERFYDNVNDPAVDDSVASFAAYQTRLQKASLAVRDYLHAPDVLVGIEIENLAVLQALADRINSDAVAAGQPNPQYAAYLEEGNDVGGIDVGFLVKTADAGAAPRVEVLAVTQVGKDAMWMQPDGTPALLNDRPPLALDAVVHYADGRSFPVVVVGVHQRSLISAEEDTAAADRVRRKRQAQAEFLANYLQSRQAGDPATRLVVLGDFNAFAFNDGLTDVMGTTGGTPAPDAETVVPGDGADLVDPDLVNLGELVPPSERYSYVFDGNAQTLDHVLVNEELIVTTRSAGIDHARINADFSDSARGDATTAQRTADHDPVIAYFAPRPLADLAVTASAANDEVLAGGTLSYAATVTNLGPEGAEQTGIGFAIDAELPDMAVAAPAGWSCDAPQVAGGMTSIACVAGLLDNGASAGFTITATATAAQIGDAAELAVAASTLSLDRNPGNDEAGTATRVVDRADLAVRLGGPAKKLHYGRIERFPLVLDNAGPNAAREAVVALRGDAPAANVAIAAPAGWQCAVNDDDDGFVAECAAANALVAGASVGFDFAIRIPARPDSTESLTLRASAGAATPDPDAGDNQAVYRNRIVGVP